MLNVYTHTHTHTPSSRSVKRPIWGKSLKVSRQMTPLARNLAMHTWSCFTKRGRVLLFSPVFLSTRQIKACGRDLKKFRTTAQVRRTGKKTPGRKWCGYSLRFALPRCRCGCEGLRCNRDKWWICAQLWRSEIEKRKRKKVQIIKSQSVNLTSQNINIALKQSRIHQFIYNLIIYILCIQTSYRVLKSVFNWWTARLSTPTLLSRYMSANSASAWRHSLQFPPPVMTDGEVCARGHGPVRRRCARSGRGCLGCTGWTRGGFLPPRCPSASTSGSPRETRRPSPRRRSAGSIPPPCAATQMC